MLSDFDVFGLYRQSGREALPPFALSAGGNMTQKDRMLAGKLYRVDETLAAHMRRTRERLHQFNLSLDPARARQYYIESRGNDDKFCTMCGPNFCAMRISQKICKELND